MNARRNSLCRVPKMKRSLGRAGIGSLAAGLFLVTLAAPSSAQNHRAQPIYGTITRVSPFSPDPVLVQVNAGGETNARDLNIGGNCRGFISAAAPLLTLNYTAGRTPLQVWVHSPADTTLIIRDPSGRWLCDDDSLVKNPAIRIAEPKSGYYHIWVGTFGSDRPAANVYITER